MRYILIAIGALTSLGVWTILSHWDERTKERSQGDDPIPGDQASLKLRLEDIRTATNVKVNDEP